MVDILIKNGMVIDGSGSPGYYASVLISGEQVNIIRGDLPDIEAEFSDTNHERGTLSMARANNPNSANSQFFICFKASPSLDRQYTVFGKVVQGMEFVDLIKRGEGSSGEVENPDKIISLTAN